MRMVVGLGNPGDRYRRTRHNVGFMVVDELASRAGAGKARQEADCWVGPAHIAGEDVLLVKPLTFMNRSGLAVERLLAGKGAAPQDLVVVLDEVALELGVLRIRERGSHGGHNGLRSLVDVLGTDDFARLRIGVRKGDPPEDLADYVLSEFPRDDVLVVQEIVGRAADAIECLLSEGPAAAMNRYNGGRRDGAAETA
ncbi:MAG TPA: aminoacyl-tRNA hydrolase [Vicinamibacteria bacterium]